MDTLLRSIQQHVWDWCRGNAVAVDAPVNEVPAENLLDDASLLHIMNQVEEFDISASDNAFEALMNAGVQDDEVSGLDSDDDGAN